VGPSFSPNLLSNTLLFEGINSSLASLKEGDFLRNLNCTRHDLVGYYNARRKSFTTEHMTSPSALVL